jgi:hypothetical protein
MRFSHRYVKFFDGADGRQIATGARACKMTAGLGLSQSKQKESS